MPVDLDAPKHVPRSSTRRIALSRISVAGKACHPKHEAASPTFRTRRVCFSNTVSRFRVLQAHGGNVLDFSQAAVDTEFIIRHSLLVVRLLVFEKGVSVLTMSTSSAFLFKNRQQCCSFPNYDCNHAVSYLDVALGQRFQLLT
jgi:hypothetical protein